MSPRRAADPGNGLHELVELWTAPNADALHRVLVLYPPMRGSADAFEPFALLKQHHETEPRTSPTTALLLLTDRRWRNAAGQLVRRIAKSSILGPDQLDLLARTFIAAADAVYWQVPEEWFAGGEEIVIDLGEDHTDQPGPDDVEQGPAVARRDVYPPLRRWAAAHLLAREPASWSALWRRAGELDARSATALAAGLLDSIDVLTPDAQAFVIDQATSWPDHTVRRLALDFIAHHQGPDVAARLGRTDPNARIRAWAASLVPDQLSHPADQRPSAVREPPEQSTLF